MTRSRLLTAALIGTLANASGDAGARFGFPAAGVAAGLHVQPPDHETGKLLRQLETIIKTADVDAYLALQASSANRNRAQAFCGDRTAARGQPRGHSGTRSRAGIRRRRSESRLPGGGGHLRRDGRRPRAATWQLEAELRDGTWRLTDQQRLSTVESLHRLSVNRTRQFDARNFVVSAEDLELTLVEGSVFTIDTDEGTIGFVLLGHGEMNFHPPSDTEKGQVKILTGDTSCIARFGAAYVRFGAASLHADLSQLIPRPVDARQLRRAERVFREESAKSYGLDLGDLSRDIWSLVPSAGDFLSRGAHQAFRNTHLRANRHGSRGHFVLRSPTRAQHRGCTRRRASSSSVVGLQRRRACRVRRQSLRRRPDRVP